MTNQVAYASQPSRDFPHVEWLELYGDKILHECVIMKRMADGSVLFFRTNDLDLYDKRRISDILSDRNARSMELWDLMSNRMLNNGVNALAYFNQLVRMLAPNGKVIDPKSGQAGITGTAQV